VIFVQAAVASTLPYNQLTGVAVAASDDAWAAGTSSSASSAQGLIEHSDGSSWNVVPSANSGATFYSFNGVGVASSNDVWAVAYTQATAGAAIQTLIEHWNGSQWSVVPSPLRR
jgi:hypothetical protein